MQRSRTTALAFMVATLIHPSTPAIAKNDKPFNVIYVSHISADGERALVQARATKSRVAAVQAEINRDRAVVSQLRARNIQIRNIIDARPSRNGKMTYYVR